MTTKETAEALGITERTVQRRASELGLTVNGVLTNLDEKAVTLIKKMVERSGRTDLDNVVELPNVSTDLEMMIMESKVTEWRIRKIEELQKQIAEAQPKIELYDIAMKSESGTDLGTVSQILSLGYGRNTLFKKLRDIKVLKPDNIPYQEFINRGYFKVIEEPYQVHGATFIGFKTLVLQRGLEYIKKAVE
jgi:phage antirepressor YoqD-like protein